MAIRAVFQGVRSQGLVTFCREAQKAHAEVTRSLKPMPPQFCEDLVMWENKIPCDAPAAYKVGYHGTSLRSVQRQIEQGFLDCKASERRIWEYLYRTGGFYIAETLNHASWYAHARAKDDQPVILQVYYNPEHVSHDTRFACPTMYTFPGEGPERVYILKVLQENPAYTEAMKPENRHQHKLFLSQLDRGKKVYAMVSRQWRKP